MPDPGTTPAHRMSTRILPDHVLRLMSPADRQVLGQKTAAETLAIADAKSEKELQEQIASMLRRRDVPFIRPAMFKKSELPPCWPDVSFAYRGVQIGWECKTIVGKLNAQQSKMHDQLRRCGWQISVIRTLQEAVEILQKLDNDA
jgi:uncharacterized protein (DUF58 family)